MTRGKIRAGEAVLVGGVRTGEPRHPRDRLPTLFYITQPLLLKRFAQLRHFSVTRYALRSRRFWSTEAVIYASPLFQSIGLSLRLCLFSIGVASA